MRMYDSRQYGKFHISRVFLEDNHEAVQAIMATCIIYRAEYSLAKDGVDYDAWCEDFSEVPLGAMMPEYTPVVRCKVRGCYLVTWE